jgi:hypothetical protein
LSSEAQCVIHSGLRELPLPEQTSVREALREMTGGRFMITYLG